MKALVYHGPGRRHGRRCPTPHPAPTDAIVRIDTTTICGTDPHILKGDVPRRAPTGGSSARGRRDHRPGPARRRHGRGRRPAWIIAASAPCGRCSYCHQGLYATARPTREPPASAGSRAPHRRHPGRVCRVPFGLTTRSTSSLTASADEAAVMLSDILPTGFEIGVALRAR
jgi:alcohol dehydrogenase